MQPLTVAHCAQLQGSTPESLASRLKIRLEDGSAPALRPNYLEQICAFCNHAPYDKNWLRVDPRTNGLIFVTHAATMLPVLLALPSIPPRRTSSAPTVSLRLPEAPLPISLQPGESLHIVLDQSGSMACMNAQVFEGAKELVRELPQDASVTITTFSDQVLLGTRATPAEGLQFLEQPPVTGGSTALRDAILQAIQMEEANGPKETTTFVVLTDGIDNCSRRTLDETRAAISRCDSRPNWRVLFLGANQDAVLSAQSMGISGARALSFDPRHAPAAMRAVSANVRGFRRSGTDAFSAADRQTSVESHA